LNAGGAFLHGFEGNRLIGAQVVQVQHAGRTAKPIE
jgi:hypothetical protein